MVLIGIMVAAALLWHNHGIITDVEDSFFDQRKNARETMAISFRKREQRRELRALAFPDEWVAYLHKNVLLYRTLSATEQGKLRDASRIFVAEKFWEGCNGLKITDEIKITIAGQACLLVLGLEDYYLDEVRTVLVYPGGYLVPNPHEERDQIHVTGVAHHKGPVVLSWWHALWEGRRLVHTNLVLHEFAHKLAELGDPEDGTPPIEDPGLEQRWRKTMRAEYEQLVEDADYQRPTLLDHYGATNPSEFFAVATECFFLSPIPLRYRHPRLYRLLADWYHQEPAERPPLEKLDSTSTEQARSEYHQHAIAECSTAIRLHPENTDAYRRRADLHFDQGEFSKAVADYGEVLRLDPEDAEAFCDRGAAYAAKGCPSEALADFGRAIRTAPDFPRPYLERAAIHAEKGDRQKALADLSRAIHLDPKDDAAYNQRGLVYCDLGKYDDALRDFNKAIRLFPDCPDFFANRASVNLGKQAYDKAIADCTTAIGLDPECAEAYRTRALAFKALGNRAKACQDQERAEQLGR
jgi:Mlc titration factor MtfA (ptsG expression regulator)/regulator of sirC expression with transglutaminase-like and TPR domain